MTLSIRNGSEQPITDIKLQTCAYLRAIRELSAFTMSNKFVHVANSGWVTFESAKGDTTLRVDTTSAGAVGPQAPISAPERKRTFMGSCFSLKDHSMSLVCGSRKGPNPGLLSLHAQRKLIDTRRSVFIIHRLPDGT